MSHVASAMLPAFFASLVEFVEALTIVLAVGVTRGWRAALLGSLAAVATLAVAVAVVGPALGRVPLAALQLVVGIALLFFGLRWLRKATLRYAGAIAFHDEGAIYAKRSQRLIVGPLRAGFDGVGFATAYQAVALEGLEVVFIVIAVGATAGALVPASLGALAAGTLVVGAGVLLRSPLSRVPENALKFFVGIMLSAFGTFWAGEAVGAAWPGGDLTVLWLIGGYGLSAAIAIGTARRGRLA